MLHAPRQTGKTSARLALRDLLNRGAAGNFHCVYTNVEAGQAAGEDAERAVRVILGDLASRARGLGDRFLYEAWPDIVATFGEAAFGEALTRWCEAAPAPIVLLIDEIDALIGDTLISVLRQLRGRYDRRPRSFPHDDPPRIANPIYAEVVPRELAAMVQAKLIQDAAWYVNADGGLDVDRLLAAFQTFFREHSEHWLGRFDYAEAGPSAHPAGVSAAGCERRRSHRARVRPGTGAGPTCSSCGRPAGGRRRTGGRAGS